MYTAECLIRLRTTGIEFHVPAAAPVAKELDPNASPYEMRGIPAVEQGSRCHGQ